MKMFFSSIIDNFDFELPEMRENDFTKITTFHDDIQRLKIPQMIETFQNVVFPSEKLFEKGTHVEITGSVLNPSKFGNIG